ncbi:Uncharacterised protein [Salmonella enterica subsp. enterica]|uniref:Uncharacterized protein n=1 Tax=Salmonella enterica I TaxID=59201 RepID=A0A379US68_SALET|nr:Uncharacterised protein [Salmonella enterica subsp. enterica]
MSFKFTVHSNRWNHTDTYTMEKNSDRLAYLSYSNKW